MFFFSCKACEGFRRDVPWFDGLHTAAVIVSNVMSADDKMCIRELARFFVCLFVLFFFCTGLAKEKRNCNFTK